MKKLLSLLLCLVLTVPCAFAEELPRSIQKGDADYAWLRESSLTIAERFQNGLDCTWHSFLLSAANVPEQEMLDALSPLRMQDYTQPWSMTIARADQLLPEETIEAWQEALKEEEAAKAARTALRSADMVNTLAQVKVVKTAEKSVELAEEAVRLIGETIEAAEESVRVATESGDPEAIEKAQERALFVQEAAKALEDAVLAAKEPDKPAAVLVSKDAFKLLDDYVKAIEEAEKAAKKAAEADELDFEEKEEEEPAEEIKTEAELAAEEALRKIKETTRAAEEAVKAAEKAVKAEENAVQAAQSLEDVKAGKYPLPKEDTPAPTADLTEQEEKAEEEPEAEEEQEEAPQETESDDDDWDDWDLDWDYDVSPALTEETRAWYIEEDPQRDLYHSAPAILNFEEDEMFNAISGAIRVSGIATREEALDGPSCCVVYYGGLYALLITYYPAGEGFISFSAQVIYSRSADDLLIPAE